MMTPLSQKMEPPGNPARFNLDRSVSRERAAKRDHPEGDPRRLESPRRLLEDFAPMADEPDRAKWQRAISTAVTVLPEPVGIWRTTLPASTSAALTSSMALIC